MSGTPPVGQRKPAIPIIKKGDPDDPRRLENTGDDETPVSPPDTSRLSSGWNQPCFRTGVPIAKQPVQFKILIFERTQIILQKPGETSENLHERLRDQATNSMSATREPTRIITPSWLTVDASKILKIKDAVLISTSTCVHEFPARIFVGIRKEGFQETLKDGRHQYSLYDLGRELTSEEKNALYDAMRAD
ncbi:MAG: hypothetical protein COV46_05885 [Deltaproteobacteria bacterium CG11_big_fil_rev_8_21_14_0_20_49_13]|nr:MAG: hypothetical protein COV46_05885 [Deltaproteobacteria bacterium CG11_big_fil_rev_8_21_14_0_20_49_13]